MDDEAFWSSDPTVLRDSEWAKISSDFTNAGYREGITAGKESALQQGFDEGFAQVGAPIGRELGILRGLCSALIAFLSRPQGTAPSPDSTLSEVREIAKQLAEVRFSDIAPPDLEALAHAKEHLGGAAMDADADEDAADLTDPAKLNEEIKEKRDMEGLEDLMAQMNADGGSGSAVQTRPKAEDVARLKERLLAIAQSLGMSLQWS
ncbi:hypothetical protein C8Q70DRAFT_919729 [Cubamyces menziesii]|uniref:Protein YAE1 n=1 Tax=Trametes cubensis TaxID=1111947 RepID=A0AAD7U4D1_9APHY|nr:hypothetical protein C8Q70DRAFT_919729 [Cubamyces menziesii]KAJ8501982.1 hypothetical protein ONZ51_g285 [Trametes cubensis]